MIRLCESCEREFEVSKFNPYFTQCKSCRKGKCSTTLRIKPKKKKKRNHLSCDRCKDHFTLSKKTGMWKCPLCRTVYTVIIPGWYKIWESDNLTNKVYFMGTFKGFHTEYNDLRSMINEHEKSITN